MRVINQLNSSRVCSIEDYGRLEYNEENNELPFVVAQILELLARKTQWHLGWLIDISLFILSC